MQSHLFGQSDDASIRYLRCIRWINIRVADLTIYSPMRAPGNMIEYYMHCTELEVSKKKNNKISVQLCIRYADLVV